MNGTSAIASVCACLSLLVTLPVTSKAAVVTDQKNEYTDPSAVPGTALGTGDYVGQVITAGIAGKLDSVEFAIRRFDGYTIGSLTLQVRDVVNGKPGSNVLGAISFPNSAVAATPALYTKFDVSALNLSFTAGQQFAIIVFPTNQSVSPFPLALSSPGTYAGGDLSASNDNGVTWQYWGNNTDTYFRTYVGEPVEIIAIDVKPGSDPNCFNIDGNGVIPVAILGSPAFDVAAIDMSSLRFGALTVRVRGKSGAMCHIENVNGDAYADLVCQFEDDPTAWAPDNAATATLKGSTLSGLLFEGSDSICVK